MPIRGGRRGRGKKLASAAREGMKIMARTSTVLSTIAASLVALWPMQTLAQEGPYDPLGLRFGGFDLHASANVSVETTDNLYAQNANQTSDTITTAGVGATLSSHWSRHSLSANVGATSYTLADHSESNTEALTAGVRGRLDVYSTTEVGGGLAWTDSYEPRTNSDSPSSGSDTLDPIEYSVATADIYAQHTFNRVRVSVRAGQTKYDYDDVHDDMLGTIDQDDRDFTEKTYGGRVEYGVSPRIYALVDVSANKRDYDTAVGRDSDGETILGGVRLQFTDLLTGEASIGQTSQDYDSGASIDGTAYSANLTWYPTPIMNVQFNASRDVQESGAYQGGYINSTYGVRVNHAPRRYLNISAGVSAGERDYEGALDRQDEYLNADISGVYTVNRRVRLRAGYVFDRNRSSGSNPGNEFDSNRFFIGVGLQL